MEYEMVWQRDYPAALGWAAFSRAAGLWGEAPRDLDTEALGGLVRDSAPASRILAEIEAAYTRTLAREDWGPIAPATGLFEARGDWTWIYGYGLGRSRVTIRPYGVGGVLVTITGPVEARSSVEDRVIAAGGEPWHHDSDPWSGWRVPTWTAVEGA